MQTTMIVIGIVIVLFGLLILMAKRRLKNMPLVPDHHKVIQLTEQNFQANAKGKLLLVDFWAAWCGPCRVQAPVLNQLSEELTGNQRIAKVNIEQQQKLAQKFKVRGIPTMILLKNGVEVKRFVGVKSKEFLLQQIRNIPAA
jgi:thioredoxin 1